MVAEGVETETQLAHLVAERCDQVQGYLCSRPMPFDDLVAFLTRQARALPGVRREDRNPVRLWPLDRDQGLPPSLKPLRTWVLRVLARGRSLSPPLRGVAGS